MSQAKSPVGMAAALEVISDLSLPRPAQRCGPQLIYNTPAHEMGQGEYLASSLG